MLGADLAVLGALGLFERRFGSARRGVGFGRPGRGRAAVGAALAFCELGRARIWLC